MRQKRTSPVNPVKRLKSDPHRQQEQKARKFLCHSIDIGWLSRHDTWDAE